jgi:cysteine synthase
VLGAIGSTPIVRLEHLVRPGMAEVFVKLASVEPSRSYGVDFGLEYPAGEQSA